MDPTPGKSFGPYEIVERLGQGGMGTLFIARHSMLGRTVALKVMRADRERTELDTSRFAREIHVAARLRHPNIVTIFDGGTIEDVAFVAMEYLEGATLEHSSAF